MTGAGLYMVPFTVAMLVVTPLVARAARRAGARAPFTAGIAICCFSYVMLAVAREQEWQVALASLVLGAGFGFAFAAMAILVVEGVPAEQTGVASGVNLVLRTIGGSAGTQVPASILTVSAAGAALPSKLGFTLAFLFPAAVCLLGLLTALAVPSRPATAARRRAQKTGVSV